MSRLNGPLLVAVTGIGGAVLVLLVVAAGLPPDRQDELMFEGAKAAIQVIPFALLTVVVAELVRERDRNRELAGRRDAIRRTFLSRVVVAYNRVKAVRRTLRGAGLGSQKVSRPINEELLRVLDQQIASLSDAQLDLERLKREAEARSDVVSKSTEVHDALERLEKYVNGVVKDWEDERPKLDVGSSSELTAWTAFRSFVASQDDETPPGDFDRASRERDVVERAIWPDLLIPGRRR